MVSTTRAQSISTAMRRVRRGVLICCWMTGLALALQIVVWSLAMFTDMRYDTVEPVQEGPAIVKAEESSHVVVPSTPVETIPGLLTGAQTVTAPPKPTRPLSENDSRFAAIAEFSSTVGIMTVLALLPLLMVGVILAAGAATPGVERTVSALSWALVLFMLVVPLTKIVPFITFTGTFVPYSDMTALVESVRGDDILIAGGMPFYLRFLLLPATCIVGLAMVGARFTTGVDAAVLPTVEALSMKLDPALEEEVSKIKASSLHGSGRSSAALRATVGSKSDPEPAPSAPLPHASQVSPGAMPRRLI